MKGIFGLWFFSLFVRLRLLNHNITPPMRMACFEDDSWEKRERGREDLLNYLLLICAWCVPLLCFYSLVAASSSLLYGGTDLSEADRKLLYGSQHSMPGLREDKTNDIHSILRLEWDDKKKVNLVNFIYSFHLNFCMRKDWFLLNRIEIWRNHTKR